jgi:hypothetical protein
LQSSKGTRQVDIKRGQAETGSLALPNCDLLSPGCVGDSNLCRPHVPTLFSNDQLRQSRQARVQTQGSSSEVKGELKNCPLSSRKPSYLPAIGSIWSPSSPLLGQRMAPYTTSARLSLPVFVNRTPLYAPNDPMYLILFIRQHTGRIQSPHRSAHDDT